MHPFPFRHSNYADLTVMGFRFSKRSSLLGGLLHLNWSKRGLSSVSVGRPGATVNFPVARDGQVRTTLGVPGTGISYVEERQC